MVQDNKKVTGFAFAIDDTASEKQYSEDARNRIEQMKQVALEARKRKRESQLA